MKIINAGYEILDNTSNNKINKLRHIERIGRVCYKSEDKITNDGESAKKFVNMLIAKGHTAMLEHSSYVFECSSDVYEELYNNIKHLANKYKFNSFIRFSNFDNRYIVSGNVRAWRDYIISAKSAKDVKFPIALFYFNSNCKELFSDLFKNDFKHGIEKDFIEISKEDLSQEEKLIHYDLTVKFIVDRGISHELVRHRVMSFAQESTRYCDYSKDKHGKEITVILPFFFDTGIGTASNSLMYSAWKRSCEGAERAYFELISYGATPQEARTVLPNSLKTEVVMTGNLKSWELFFELRVPISAHPQMREVSIPLLNELKIKLPIIFDDICVSK